MTARAYKRLRKWDRKVHASYSAGVMDGMDAFHEGRERPDALTGEFDTKVYLRQRMRYAQWILNASIARSRGRYDGWEIAARETQKAQDEDWIATQVVDGIAKFERFLEAA